MGKQSVKQRIGRFNLEECDKWRIQRAEVSQAKWLILYESYLLLITSSETDRRHLIGRDSRRFCSGSRILRLGLCINRNLQIRFFLGFIFNINQLINKKKVTIKNVIGQIRSGYLWFSKWVFYWFYYHHCGSVLLVRDPRTARTHGPVRDFQFFLDQSISVRRSRLSVKKYENGLIWCPL